ncbi:hypothetical protein VL10_ORF190 [Staphylococcus phage vB_SauM_VL10]|nr:hypothetical protein VL10_ORF190 [Staphylococcus phage vB_SauM_VL10]
MIIKKTYTCKELIEKYFKGNLKEGIYKGSSDGTDTCYLLLENNRIGMYREKDNSMTIGYQIPLDASFVVEEEITHDTKLENCWVLLNSYAKELCMDNMGNVSINDCIEVYGDELLTVSILIHGSFVNVWRNDDYFNRGIE